jgi:hypothetical protein
MNVNDIATFDWDDEIEKESDFILLDEGDYDFEIETFERGQFDGSEKTPPCKKAIVHFKVKDSIEGNEVTLKKDYCLAKNWEGLISQLFKSVGLKKTGERIKMNWNALPGKKGRCHIIKTKGKNGNEYNNIGKLYAKEEDGDDW